MSLSEMARTPFSLVDEINQGMDARAEENVHNQLVEVTCNTDAGQYFLITPKLLQHLNYHPKMKVLVVNNGAFCELSICLRVAVLMTSARLDQAGSAMGRSQRVFGQVSSESRHCRSLDHRPGGFIMQCICAGPR